jgi:hypothetical protein
MALGKALSSLAMPMAIDVTDSESLPRRTRHLFEARFDTT